MTPDLLRERVLQRLTFHAVEAPETVLAQSSAYLELLCRWNRTINLTALAFDEGRIEASVDKLIVEPLLAARLLASLRISPTVWVDLGSGGGSPAIPLRLVCKSGTLQMVESRARKCAFLREAVRRLGLSGTSVLNQRFEQLVGRADTDLVSVRAVRLDRPLLDITASMLHTGGVLLSFGAPMDDPRFSLLGEQALPDGSTLFLFRYANVPRGTFGWSGLDVSHSPG